MSTRREFLVETAKIAGSLAVAGASISSAAEVGEPEDRAARFLAGHLDRLKPLEKKANLAWWAANISGKDDDFAAKEETQNQLDAILSDRERFAELKAIRGGSGLEKGTARQLDVLYSAYAEKQVDPALLKKITAKANAIEKAFNVYRARVDGVELTDSEVRKTLKQSKDSTRRQAVWESSKGVGTLVEADLKDLVNLRNEAAHGLGYANYHEMSLRLNEQEPAAVLALFDELDTLTRAPFQSAKAEIDVRLAKNVGVSTAGLRPWHYHDPFFQEPQAVFDADLDAPYAKVDIPAVCREFYDGIGLPVIDVLSRSDLFEKSGKSPHAFCTDIDREGDVRVLANVVANEYWMGTMLHELGHSVYSSKNIPRSLPYILRTESHILTTEGVAMMFERFSKDADWLKDMGISVADPAAFDATGARMIRDKLLIFSRWCQVMLRFESALYANPDQDLNALWWGLVENYQGLKKPEGRDTPDYASKIHIVSAPCYYHNYMMGQLFASQVHAAICKEALGGVSPSQARYAGKKVVGAFLTEKVFAPGKSLGWNDLTRFATGEDLNPRAFSAEFRGA